MRRSNCSELSRRGTRIEPGSPQLIVVMAHWCPHCQAEIPRIVDWNTDGDCTIDERDDTADDGEASIPVGRIETFESDKDEECEVELEVIRSASGEIDPAFTEGGNIVARQVRTGSFTSTP